MAICICKRNRRNRHCEAHMGFINKPAPRVVYIELSGLPGAATPTLRAACVASPSEAMRMLSVLTAVTSAGDAGAINAWVDSDGRYRANFCVRMLIRQQAIFGTRAALASWLREKWPLLGRDVRKAVA